MNRREFLASTAALVGTASLRPGLLAAQGDTNTAAASGQLHEFFLQIADGFFTNAARTSATLAVCDFPDGKMLPGCSTPGGKTYVSVARMLPALAWWHRSKREPQQFEFAGKKQPLEELLLLTYRNAFDPTSPDYWGEARKDKADQKQVEASLTAYALFILGDPFLEKLGAGGRSNVQAWLASCTVVPEHKHNHAWFSAINQAVRLKLSEKWKEFSGDADWMMKDLDAIEGMAIADDHGWYNDWPDGRVFDYYNFWTFASHYLYWDEIIGNKYPKVQLRFRARLNLFLECTPYFFGSNGSHVLFGRSLIYRWAVLMPMVLAYRRGLWPHSPGLLRAVVRRNIEFCRSIGAFDKERGKLRETYSAEGTRDVCERYIDNGHPYWGMQSFAFFEIPDNDPFWTAPEEALPVEQKDFKLLFEKLGMIVYGDKASGEVRWAESQNMHKETYRDKYLKFSYSSHFPFNVIAEKNRIPWDQTLIFRLPDGTTAARSGIVGGGINEHGTWTDWTADLGELEISVHSTVKLHGRFELRTHEITIKGTLPDGGIETLEGSYSLGTAKGETATPEDLESGAAVRLRTSVVAAWDRDSGRTATVDNKFYDDSTANVIYPAMSLITIRGKLSEPKTRLTGLFYASTRAPDQRQLNMEAAAIP